jgi:hypothetical protein
MDRVNVRQVRRADLPDLEWDGEYTHFQRLYADIFQSANQGLAVLWLAELEEQGKTDLLE